MDLLYDEFHYARDRQNGYLLANAITPTPPPSDVARLYRIVKSSNHQAIPHDVRHGLTSSKHSRIPKSELNAWVEVLIAYWKLAADFNLATEATFQGKVRDVHWNRVYDGWKEVVNALLRGYSSGQFAAWTVPCLYTAGKYLRIFAIKADQLASSGAATDFQGGLDEEIGDALEKNDKLEDAARQINRIFSLCIGDRAPLEESRKWGLYYTANLMFKTYFKLNSISLCKNILRSLQASVDTPSIDLFPKSHIVTFKYYVGVINFLEENYKAAEENLTTAFQLCKASAVRNLELILTYLIPSRLLTTKSLPSTALLSRSPKLQRLFAPLCRCIKKGDLAGFDDAMEAGRDEFVKRRIYLTLERGRDLALRNLFRKVFLAGGVAENGDRRTRVEVNEFAAGVRIASQGVQDRPDVERREVDRDEVEFLISNLIYKNMIKGYIAHDRGIVVLSKKGDAFPGTGI